VKLINADYKAITDQLELVLRILEAPRLAFKREEERQRREAEEVARKERERVEAEARARAEEERKRLEEARSKQEEAESLVQSASNPFEAFKAENAVQAAASQVEGARQATEDALREAAMAPMSVPVLAPPKVTAAGTSFRKNWKFRIVNVGLVPREFMIPNEQMLGQIARTAKENANVPGVEFYAEESIGGR